MSDGPASNPVADEIIRPDGLISDVPDPVIDDELGSEEPTSLGNLAPVATSPGVQALAQSMHATTASLPSFIDSLRLPLQEPLIDATLIRWASHQVSPVVPCLRQCGLHGRSGNAEGDGGRG